MDDQYFYEQAISEIRERRVIEAVWAKAFAEADGDQKRTTARYIAIRVEQMKAAQQDKAEQAKSPDKPKLPWWHWILRSIGMVLLIKLIGPLPAGLTLLCYLWLRRRHSSIAAIAGAGVAGMCLALIASYVLPPDAKLKPESSARLSYGENRSDSDYAKNKTAWEKRVEDIRASAERGEIPTSHLLTTGTYTDLIPGSYHAALLSEQTQTWWRTESEFSIYFQNPASTTVRALEFSYNYGECSPNVKGETYVAELATPVSGNGVSLISFPSIDTEHRNGCLTISRIYH